MWPSPVPFALLRRNPARRGERRRAVGHPPGLQGALGRAGQPRETMTQPGLPVCLLSVRFSRADF